MARISQIIGLSLYFIICTISFSINKPSSTRGGTGFTRNALLVNAATAKGSRQSLCMVDVPEITLKLAIDKNGAVDDLTQKPERFTSEESLDAVHRLRAKMDAVMVGVGTIYRDNPSLTVRRVPYDKKSQPLRIIVDGKLTIPGPESGVTVLTDGNPTVVFFTEMGPMGWVVPEDMPKGKNPSRYWRAGSHMLGLLGNPVSFKRLPIDDTVSLLKEQFKFSSMFEELKTIGNFEQILLEGGPTLAQQFLEQGYVTRAIIVKAPVEFTGDPVPSNVDNDVLTRAGLELVGTQKWGTDDVEMWSKPDVAWPQDDINAWP